MERWSTTSVTTFSPVAYLCYVVLWPISKFSTFLSKCLLRLVGMKMDAEGTDEGFSKVDLDYLVQSSIDNATNEDEINDEVKIFQNALDFSDTKVREMRKNLMQKIIPSYEGEVWCISKHLLASAMRLMEVGTKQQSLKNTKDAYSLFNQAYDLYCLFWGLNMNLIDSKDLKWVEDTNYKEIAAKAQEVTAKVGDTDITPDVASVQPAEAEEPADGAQVTGFKKMKNFLRKAIDCCIE